MTVEQILADYVRDELVRPLHRHLALTQTPDSVISSTSWSNTAPQPSLKPISSCSLRMAGSRCIAMARYFVPPDGVRSSSMIAVNRSGPVCGRNPGPERRSTPGARWGHLEEAAGVVVLLAVGTAHDGVELATGAEVDLDDGRLPRLAA